MPDANRPNQDALYNALNLYRDAMRPFVFRNLKTVHTLATEDRFENSVDIDINHFPPLFRRYWQNAFAHRFDPDRDIRSAIGLITEARNRVSHPGAEDLSREYALARLHDIAEVLGQINAPEQKQQVEAIRDRLFTSAVPATEVKPKLPRRKPTELTPWHQVISPNNDVIEGTFRKSEFAADLQEVFEGKAKAAEYGEAGLFFSQTYITPGLRQLLLNTLSRLGSKGGDPVIQLKTGFGGGKTHSLIALYHLVTGADALTQPPPDEEYAQLHADIHKIMQEAEWEPDTALSANVSVLVGTYLSTTDADKTTRGDPLNTLWGRMADQLGGQDAYEFIADAAREGISPGGKQLDELFEYVGPSVILIDELVAYVRNVQGVTQESIYTFFQTLTESVKRTNDVTLVATLPEGHVQAGGEGGMSVMDGLESILERVDAVSIPLEVDNAFQVVRRRLFRGIKDETERDLTCDAFRKMYQNSRREYPDEASEATYFQRMKACYPIHPEIFDRLSQDWVVIPGFQRTRGVLRIMASCISRLYQQQDASPLIMPGNLTLDDPALADEFTRLLSRSGGNWDPVVKEVDSHGSRTDQIDKTSKTFIEVGSAARRLARAIFLGSTNTGAVRGISERQIHLGVVEPGQTVSIYNDALRRMTGNLYFLYNLDDRHYFHTQENLNKVANDRAEQYTEDDIYREIISRLKKVIGRDPNVIVCPASPTEVKDSETVQYVILPPQASLPSREKEQNTAHAAAHNMLIYCSDGQAQRTFRNTLLFIAARRDELRELKNLIKNYLAWNAIMNGDELHSAITNLTGTRLDQATDKLESADERVTTALFKAYRWTVAPTQADPQKDDYGFSADAIEPAEDGRIIQRARDKFIYDEAIITRITTAIFDEKLQQYVWSSDIYQNHIQIDKLWELLATHVYMPRLRDRNILATCIREGVAVGTFGYAHAYENEKYQNPRFMEQVGTLSINHDTTAVLINPEVAKQLKGEHLVEPAPPEPGLGPQASETDEQSESTPTNGPTRLVVTKSLQLEQPFLADIETIQDEIVRTLQTDGANVTVEITVTADKSDGFSEHTERAVRQNSEYLNAEFKHS